jgi:hypothetical protein
MTSGLTMSAITLNLLAEEQLAQEARARDPFKTAIAIGAGLIALVAMTGSVLFWFASQRKSEGDILRSKWETLSASMEKGEVAEFRALTAQANDVMTLNKSRVLLAPQLALVKDIVPDAIQLTRLNFSVNVETPMAGAAEETEHAETNAKAKRKAAPKVTERLTLMIEGRAVGARPEIEVDSFIGTLRSNPQFGALVSQIQLRSIARAPVSGDNPAAGSPVALFVIECQYKERK